MQRDAELARARRPRASSRRRCLAGGGRDHLGGGDDVDVDEMTKRRGRLFPGRRPAEPSPPATSSAKFDPLGKFDVRAPPRG